VKRAFVLLALAACGHSAPAVSPAAPPAPKDPLVAFETVRSVLQSPRCQNCHTAGDTPLQGDDSHPHTMNVQRGPDGYGRVGEECQTCHRTSNLPDSYGANLPPGVSTAWHMPSPETKLPFVGVAPKDLCALLKDPAKNGGDNLAAIRASLEEPLMKWGWSPGAGRAPIAIPRDQFLAAWDAWAGAGAPCPP
jgi:hypothetical protein